MANITEKGRTDTGLKVEVRKDFYVGLWNIVYSAGGKYAGPFKTKKEAVERMKELVAA